MGPRVTLVSAVDGISTLAFITVDFFNPLGSVFTVKYSAVPAVLSTTFLFSSSKLTARAEIESRTPVCDPVKELVAPLTICISGTKSPPWFVAFTVTLASALGLEELDPVIANLSNSHKSNPLAFFLNSSTLYILAAES